jgi:hypothetical protein
MKEKSGTYYANLMNVCENEKFSHFWWVSRKFSSVCECEWMWHRI